MCKVAQVPAMSVVVLDGEAEREKYVGIKIGLAAVKLKLKTI